MKRGAAYVLAGLALAACAAPAPTRQPLAAPAGYDAVQTPQGLAVTRITVPFGYAEGAEAKRAANAYCGAAGVASGTEDHFRAGAWIYPAGCA